MKSMLTMKYMNMQRLKLMALCLAALHVALAAQAQGTKKLVNWREARITNVGAYMVDMEVKVMQDELTKQLDTVFVDHSRVVWEKDGVDIVNIENNDFYREGIPLDGDLEPTHDEEVDSLLRSVRSNLRKVTAKDQYGCLQKYVFNNFYYMVFQFEYPSVDADGKPIMLSAMAACPTRKGTSRVNNVILGTHITITANYQRPSARDNNWDTDDWGMLFSLAANNKMSYSSWFYLVQYALDIFTGSYDHTITLLKNAISASKNTNCNNCLVIMPDYEGYGLTSGRAHPYLYQELTARQSVDALLYGKALYESAPELDDVRHPIRSNYRTMSCGYSQGGSVAMACHRFIEQNHLSKDLHFVGSICGDGPYDPMATLMYYMKNDLANKKMSMVVVLPLIIKGMLDTNPYMKSHAATDYFRPEFLNTGIMDWIASKQFNTDEIKNKFARLGGIFDSDGKALMRNIMNEACYNYFKGVYQANSTTFTNAAGIPLPAHRGVLEDLHFALASNDMTTGWNPKGTIQLFHSKDDTVVPYVNAESAFNRLRSGSGAVRFEFITGKDHIDAGVAFFSQNTSFAVVVLNGLRLCEYVNYMGDKSY